MRIERLGLTRYGHFTDFDIGFARPDPRALDLHIVYGNNEAGKSTLFSALLDLLYGIPLRTGYAFRHDGQALRIDATLHSASGTLTLARQKKALLDATGQTVPEVALQSLLGGISRQNYEQMFSLNDATLEQGGDDILASKGETGSLLFSAATGLTGIHRRLDELLAADSEFYAPRKRKTVLKASISELKDLAERRKTLDRQVSQHRELQRATDAARQHYEVAAAAHQQHREQLQTLQAQQQALTALQQRERAAATLASLPELPAVPTAWWQNATAFLQTAVEAQTRLDNLQRTIATQQAEVDGYAPDQPALDAEASIRSLATQAELVSTLQSDLASDATDPHQLDAAIEQFCQRLGLPPDARPESWPSAERRQQLRVQLTEHDDLQVRLREARREATEARSNLAELPERPASADDADASALKDWLAAYAADRQGTPVSSLALQCRQQQNLIDTLLQTLQAGQRSAESLLALPVPETASLERRRDELLRLATERRSGQAQLRQGQQSVARQQTELQQISQSAPWADEDRLQQQTGLRRQCWTTHCELITRAGQTAELLASAERFDAALQQEHEMRRQREQQSDTVAQHRQLRRALTAAELEQERLQSHCNELDAAIEAQHSDLADIATTLGLPATSTIEQLLAWGRQREHLAVEAHKLMDLQQAHDSAIRAREALRQRLEDLLQQLAAGRTPAERQRYALAATDTAATLEERVQAAHRVVQRLDAEAETARSHQRERTAAEQSLRRRERAVTELTGQLATWQSDWQQAVSGTCLDAVPPAQAHDRLADLERLEPLVDTRQRYQQRQSRLDREREHYDAALTALTATLKLNAAEPAEHRLRIAGERLDAALRDHNRQHERQSALAATRDQLTSLTVELQPVLTQLDEQCQTLGADTVSALQERLDTVRQQQEALAQKQAAETTLVEILRSDSVESAIRSMQDVDADRLVTALDACQREEAELAEARAEAHAALKAAERDLASLGHDKAAARLEEEIVSLQLQLEERARQSLRLRLGSAALREGMRHYQQAHRSALLDSASSAFRSLTRGHYRRLVVQAEGQQTDRLYALAADGSTRVASTLSTGTRLQLYLALRIAAYREYARHSTPPPFVADDIFESFDDERTLQALHQFAELAELGQFIYLTHHERVVELAHQASDGRARVHRLPDAAQVATAAAASVAGSA